MLQWTDWSLKLCVEESFATIKEDSCPRLLLLYFVSVKFTVCGMLKSMHGFSKFVIETDSHFAVDLVNGTCWLNHPCYKLVEEIRWRLDDLESLSVAHIDRKANGIADCFAKFVVSSFCNDMFFFFCSFLCLRVNNAWCNFFV